MGTKNLSDRKEILSNSMEVLVKPSEAQNYLMNLQIKSTRQIFAAKLKKQRIAKGISQADLAFYMDISQNHISKIESGKLNISLDTLLKMAYFLDTVIFLRDKTDPENKIYFSI